MKTPDRYPVRTAINILTGRMEECYDLQRQAMSQDDANDWFIRGETYRRATAIVKEHLNHLIDRPLE